jgi:acyl-CoA thioester hydrolase
VDKQPDFRTAIDPDWIDHNGHMNVAYYVLAFDEATDAAYERWGLGIDYPVTSGCSVFTLGMNVDYFSELFAGDHVRITTTLVDFDHKRVHYLHRMYDDKSGQLTASNECLGMNVDLESRRSTAFPDSIRSRLESALEHGGSLQQLGRVLSIRRER